MFQLHTPSRRLYDDPDDTLSRLYERDEDADDLATASWPFDIE
jgi:hypothetical protein